MTIQQSVRRAQRTLLVSALSASFFVSAGVVLFLLGLAAFAGLHSRAVYAPCILIGFGLLLFLLWRLRAIRSTERVALWIEEIIPDLHYAVVTAATASAPDPVLEGSVHSEELSTKVERRAAFALLRAGALLLLAFAAYGFSPATSFGRVRVQGALAGAFPRSVSPLNKVESLRIQITPPAYTRQTEKRFTNPAGISTIAGSLVLISGDGSPDGVTISISGDPLAVRSAGDTWTASFVASAPLSIVRAAFQSHRRLVTVEAIRDNPPRVTLLAPDRDTTLRNPSYSVPLEAEIADDIGLAAGYFEYLVVSGSGESFAGRTVTSPPVAFASRTGHMRALLTFSSLNIGPGDLISVRAVARDNNSVTGPSIGTSDTRTFRVARADEYDSVSVDAAGPLPVDSSAMSQRMLILMTEALVKKQKTLPRTELIKQSDEIGVMEDRVRKRVYDILFQTDSPEGAGDTEEAESEIVAITNTDLKTAYDALWDAVRSLRIAEPAVALPPMRIALKALDRARLAKRLYLRGATPRIVVDVSRVRLTGKERGQSSSRTNRFVPDSAQRLFRTRLEAAFSHRSNPQQMLEDLSVLRVQAGDVSPSLARALSDAIDALQKNRDVTSFLGRLRKSFDEFAPVPSGASGWSGGG